MSLCILISGMIFAMSTSKMLIDQAAKIPESTSEVLSWGVIHRLCEYTGSQGNVK